MPPMPCSARPLPPVALLLPLLAAAALSGACTWDPWIPGESRWNPPIVADPETLAQDLPLDALYVDELDCYAQRCRERFRVVVDEPGTLTVRLVPELSHADARARLVLEALQGVRGQASSGRGPHEDVVVLAVREPVDPGVYFVLLQSVGGPMPYQLLASLAPGEGPEPVPEPAPPRARPRPEGAPPSLARVDLPGRAVAAYDPAVSFDRLRTFAFPAPVRPGEGTPAGTVVDQPVQRQVRRMLAEGLTMKGLRQATGGPADLLVDFSLGETIRAWRPLYFLYDWYDFGALHTRGVDEVVSRATLTVDMLDTRTDRVAWHAWTTRGLGPGVTYGESSTAMLREAIAEILGPFPPR